MTIIARITVEAPVLSVGSVPADYEALGSEVEGLRRPAGLHLTLLHIGVLADFARDVQLWTKGISSAEDAASATVAWLRGLPVLPGFSAGSGRLLVLGGGGVAGLEVEVPAPVQRFQLSLVEGLHGLLDGLLVDNVDDFILSSPALGFRYPHWTPHIAIGRPKRSDSGHRESYPRGIGPLAVEFGATRIRNAQFLPPDASSPH